MGSEDVTLRADETTHPERGQGDTPERFDRFGRFVVLERIGSGGAGVVYRAYDPQLDRSVAIKVLHGGDATVRLLAEARAMAKLRHPNVVAVHDVGEADGRVWLAMEYVEGGTLRQWLDAEARTEREILEVFRRAGAGLAAAHGEGLVHRDFKPDNVLMHDSGRPAVTDFGLALLEERSTSPAEGTALGDETLTSRLAGTPAYMSPEQFTGQVVGPASDQYSFGVALFEAVCRRRPFEGASVPELCKRVVDGAFEFPPGVAVRPWLRSVLERMLKRDPEDRFVSMHAAVRALDREPVVRRRRMLGAGVVVAAVAGAVGAFADDGDTACDAGASTVAEVWGSEQRQALEEAILRADVGVAAASMPVVYEALDGWASAWATAYDDACEATVVRGSQSHLRMALRHECLEDQLGHVASLTEELGAADGDAVRKAFDATRKLPRPLECEDPMSSRALTPREREAMRWNARARVRNDLGRYASGLIATERGLAVLEAQASPVRVELLAAQGQLARRAGDNTRAEASLREAVLVHADAANPLAAARAWLELSLLVGEVLGESDRAEGVLLATQAAVRALGDPDMERRLASVQGSVWVRAGRLDEGVASLQRAVELSATLEDPVARSVVLGNYGNALYEAGRYEEALKAFDEALELDVEGLPPGHPTFVLDHQNRSRALHRLGRNEDAVEELRGAIEAGERSFGPDGPQLGGPHLNLAVSLMEMRAYEEAERHIERAVELWTGAYPPTHRYFDIADTNLGIIANQQGHSEEALEHYRRSKARAIERDGPKAASVSTPLLNEANALFDLGRYEESAAGHREAQAIVAATEGAEHPGLGYPLIGLARALLALERYDDAVAAAEHARAVREGKVGPAEMYLTNITLAEALARSGALSEARVRADAAARSFAETGLDDALAKELRAFDEVFGRPGDAAD